MAMTGGAWNLQTSVSSSSAWATQVEEEEKESGGMIKLPPILGERPRIQVGGGDSAFPTLGEAVKANPKSKKSKPVTLDLREFQQSYGSAGARIQAKRREESVTNLPTGPRQRGEDDDASGLGGGFKGFSRDGPSRGGYGRDDMSDGGSQRGDDGPSRADMSDNWGRDTKFSSGGGGGGRPGGGFGTARSGGFGGSRDGSADGRYEDTSRADSASTWGNKQFVPAPERRAGGGFDDRPSRGFDDRNSRNYEFSDRDSSRADTGDRWERRAPPADTSRSGGYEDSRFGGFGGSRRGGSPTAPSASERPRLNLLGRTKPLPEIVVVKEPEPAPTAVEELPKPPLVPRPKANPFGAARPREEVLKEKELVNKGTKGCGEDVEAKTAGATANGSVEDPAEKEEKARVDKEPEYGAVEAAKVEGSPASKEEAAGATEEVSPTGAHDEAAQNE